MITDDMVRLALAAYWHSGPGTDDGGVKYMRDALEAVAPMLIAQGMREAAKIVVKKLDGIYQLNGDLEDEDVELGWVVKEAILARAQELDPK